MNIKKIMLKITLVCSLIVILAYLFSCQKDEAVNKVNIAKINVINAVVEGGAIKANVGVKRLPWKSIADAQILGGIGNLNRLYIVPTYLSTNLQIAPVSDTTKLWYDQIKQLISGKMYTLYISGTASHVKTLFQEEINFPRMIIRDAGRRIPVTDSIVNIRFVNLSPSGPAIDVNIQGKSTKEASNITNENFTNFKTYSATFDKYSVVFEIRRSSDQLLLNTYELDLDTFRFKSVAIVVMGNFRIEAIPYQ